MSAAPASTSEAGRRDSRGLAQILLALAGLLVLAVLVRRAGVDAVRHTLAQVQPGWLVFYAILVSLLFLGFALRWRLLLAALGAEVRLPRLYGVRLAGLSVGSITPAAKLGGEPLRAYLLVRGGVAPGTAIASVIVDRGLDLVANVVFGVGYCALFALRDSTTAAHFLVPIALSGIALAYGVVAVTSRLRRGRSLVPDRFRSAFARIGASEATVSATDDALRLLLFTRGRLVAGCLLASLCFNAMIFAEYATLFAAFSARPTLPELAGAMLGVGLAHALPIPASLGALEGAQAVVFHIAGSTASLALVAATVARVRDLVWTVPGAVYLILRVSRWREVVR